MPQRRPKRSPRRPIHHTAAAALVLVVASSTVSASFLTAPLDALRARAFLSPRALAVPNTKTPVTYSNASASLPTVVDTTAAQGRYGHSAVYLPPPTNELLLIGGQVGEADTAITSDVLRFRLASSLVWAADRPLSSIPDNPLKNSSLATGLPASAWGAAAVDSQGRAWLVGGVTADCDKDAIAHVLSPSSSSSSSSWTVPALAPRYPPRRRQASALAVANATTGGTDLWVLGGIADSWTCSSDTIGYAGVDRYDTVSGLVESMPWNAPGGVDPAEWEPPVSDYAAVVLAGGVGILVVGGQGSDGHLADTAEVLNFDVASRSWTQQSVANLAPAPRMGHASVLLDSGSIVIHGGLSSAHNVLSDLFLLSPSTSGWTWTQLVTSDHSEASPALAYHSATQIAGGTIVVAFGIDGATSAPSGEFWFLTVDEDAGAYTWTDQFGGNADAVAALGAADAAATTTFAAKFSKKTFEVIANPKAQSGEAAAAATVAPSLGAYGTPESEAPISAPGYTSSLSSRTSPRTSSSAAATAAKSPSSSAATASQDEAPTPKSTIIGASLGAIGAVAAAGLLFFLVRRRAATQGGPRAPSSPIMGSASRADGAAPPLVSQLMYTRRAQARNMSLGSTLSALSPPALDVDEGSPNMAGIGAAASASPDPFNDAYRVTEVGQLERAGSAASGTSSTGGVVGAVLASVSGLVAPSQQQQQQHGDTYTSPAPTLSAKRSMRRPAAPSSSSLPVPGTPAELIGMAITSDDGHDGLPYVASSTSTHSHGAAPAVVAAAAGSSSWDPARSQRPLSAPPAPPVPSSRDARTLDLDASPVPAILRPGTPLRVANPDPFADHINNQIVISSSSSSGPVDPDKPSPLLSLPDELLDIICGKVHVAKLSPICRRLYPFQQKQLYQNGVTIRSYKGLASLCATVHNSSVVANYIDNLSVNMNRATPSQVVSPRQFYDLVRRLSRLQAFQIFLIEPALLNVILFNVEGDLVFPRLERLAFSTDKMRPPAGGDDDGDWVRNLARLPQLRSLSVKMTAESSPLPPMQPPLPVFPSLARLALEGANFDVSDAPALVDLAPHVVELHLGDNISAPACASILRTAPTGLRLLYLLSPLWKPVSQRDGCILDNVLPRFTRIEDLHLCAHSFTPSRLAAYLASLPSLRTLRFGWASRPTDDLIHELFVDDNSPHRLRHLHTLELNHTSDYRGPTLEENGSKFPAGATSALDGLDEGWHPAVWPTGCSAEGTKATVMAARAAGIEVDGIGVDAASWDEAYGRERRMRFLVWGLQTGDFAQARVECGAAAIDEWLEAVEKARHGDARLDELLRAFEEARQEAVQQ